jgi:hypothetical protein
MVFLYILLARLIVVVIFALYFLFLKLMSKYGPGLADRFGAEKKSGERNRLEINNAALLIAFVIFFIMLMPQTNNILFFTIAILFIIRAFFGRFSVMRSIAMFSGAFMTGILVTGLSIGLLSNLQTIVVVILAAPLLILGFSRPCK